ncbi:type II secretion system minor pseudopilin GspK [Tolumonas osonensis]|uniref:Type II secretion system protein K n=1 Tax=Tolumonas osonensis TaxID=675874 RepID=A0A841GAC7_9GAMM|nr:type II secretion system minor pseudopilin GspK [Tolumonas osonensis]MBB6054577.1 general secretion pathway protein K [Tolumonas osonensis]
MRQQRGMALLVVLLLLAVMVTMASSMTERYRMQWQRTYNQQLQQQNYWYLLGSENLISKILIQDFKDNPEKTSLNQYWATEGQIFPVESSTLQGVVRDQQACFNLNALSNNITDETAITASATYRATVFQDLLINLGAEEYRAQQITAAVQDWLDTNTIVRSLGAEDSEYEAQTPPYLPANGRMLDVSELRAVRGMDATLYRRLLPQVCVIPETTLQINPNTLRPIHAPLLAAMFLNDLSIDDAHSILEQRPPEGWDSVASFLELNALSNTTSAGDQVQSALTIKSFYFLATLQADTDNYQSRLISLFQRQSNNQVTVIRRHFGGLE